MKPLTPFRSLAVLTLALGTAATTAQANELANPSFETVGPNGNPAVWTGLSAGAWTAADAWYLFHNTQGTTTTELVTTTAPGNPGDAMLHVVTDGHANGIAQVPVPGNAPQRVYTEVWVYVVSGTVIMASGNVGNPGAFDFSTTTGQWELLTGDNTTCPYLTTIVYAWNGPAEFYVDVASVEQQPNSPDIDGSGAVDIEDLLFTLAEWGQCSSCCVSDQDQSGTVDIEDLLTLLAQWG